MANKRRLKEFWFEVRAVTSPLKTLLIGVDAESAEAAQAGLARVFDPGDDTLRLDVPFSRHMPSRDSDHAFVRVEIEMDALRNARPLREDDDDE